jgi:hypothetical protein
MRNFCFKHVIASIILLCSLFISNKLNAQGKTDLQILSGINRGFGIGSNLLIQDISNDFPFDIKFGFGYTWLNPGNSSKARKIFINNATNGVPEKKGHSFDIRLDLMKSTTIMGNSNSYWYFGPRFSRFKGNFKYVGGNEDFDITSSQFGLGAGIESHYTISNNLKLVITGGLDYFLSAKLQGHDTSYSPDNDNVNARTKNDNGDKYDFKDANKAIDQPQFMPRLLIGVQFNI